MVTNMFSVAGSMVVGARNFLGGLVIHPELEITALETDASGRKRRAIGSHTSLSPVLSPVTSRMQQLPGCYPPSPSPPPSKLPVASSLSLPTPPGSRRNSAQSEERHDSPMAALAEPVLESEPERKGRRIPASPIVKTSVQRNAQRDRDVDQLIDRTKRAVLESAEEKSLRRQIRRHKEQEVKAQQLARQNAEAEKQAAWKIEEQRQLDAHNAQFKEFNAKWEAEQARKEDARIQEEIRREQSNIEQRRLKALIQQREDERAMQIARDAQEEEDRAREEVEWEQKRLQYAAQYEERIRKERLRADKQKELAKQAKALRIHDEEPEQEIQSSLLRGEQQKLIHPLGAHWSNAIDEAMSTKNRQANLAKTADGTDLSRHDFGSLLPQSGTADDPSGWLNDEVVNGFLANIVARKLEKTGYVKGPNHVPAFVAMSSAWYTNYAKKGISGIATWTRRKQIKGDKLLSCERIFFPINTGAHWMLLVISPKDRTIEFLDSMNSSNRKFFGIAREFLEQELGDKYDPEKWIELPTLSARQSNSDDCGVFTCFNALAAAKNIDYAQVGHGGMDDARRLLAAVLLNGGLKEDFEL